MIDGKVSAAPPCAADPHDAASQLHCTVKAPVYDTHDRQTDRQIVARLAVGSVPLVAAKVPNLYSELGWRLVWLGSVMMAAYQSLSCHSTAGRRRLCKARVSVRRCSMGRMGKFEECLSSFRPAASSLAGKHRDAAVLQHREFAAINLFADATGHPVHHSASCPILLRSDSERGGGAKHYVAVGASPAIGVSTSRCARDGQASLHGFAQKSPLRGERQRDPSTNPNIQRHEPKASIAKRTKSVCLEVQPGQVRRRDVHVSSICPFRALTTLAAIAKLQPKACRSRQC